MKLAIHKIKLKAEIDRFRVLHWGIFSFLFLAIFYEAIELKNWAEFIIETLFLTSYFFFLRRLIKRLSYAFWPFIAFIAIFLLLKLTSTPFWSLRFLCFFLAFTFTFIEAYFLWTPLFYPIVSWWEYDFRYRDDLRVQIIIGEEILEGRLTDLRRNAGCVVCFKNIKMGEIIKIQPLQDFENVTFEAEIISKRRYSIGRPFNYGIKFKIDTSLRVYQHFCTFWKNERKNKRKKKFTGGSPSPQ